MRKSRSRCLIISLYLLGTIIFISGAYILYRQRKPAREQATGIPSIAQKETASKEHPKEIKLAVETTIPTEQLEPPPKRNFLEGITIGDHLGVLVCRRDYMCSMRTVSAPSWPTHYSPDVYRFSTNVVVYALTHGGISDYSHYIPEDTITDRISIATPIVVPTLEVKER